MHMQQPFMDDSPKTINTANSDSTARPLDRRYTFGEGTMDSLNQLLQNLGTPPSANSDRHGGHAASGDAHLVIPPSFARHASTRSADLKHIV